MSSQELYQELHVDTLVTKPCLFFGQKKMYHVSIVKKPIVVPLSLNTGNKLARSRFSSWWCPDQIQGVWLLFMALKITHPESKWKEFFSTAGIVNGQKCSILVVTETFYNNNRAEIQGFKAYEHMKIFRGNELGRGREYAVDEYTCDVPVLPDTIRVLEWDFIKNYVKIVPDNEANIYIKIHQDDKKYGKHMQDHQHPIKPWIYYGYDDISPRMNKYFEKHPDAVPYFRVTYEGKGIYEAFRERVPEETWRKFLNYSEVKWLPKPIHYTDTSISYFNAEGITRFAEYTLPVMLKVLTKEKLKFETIVSPNHVVAADKYQIVVDPELYKESTAYGIPSEEKYPLLTESLIYDAIEDFNRIDQKYKDTFAKNIFHAMKEFHISKNVIGERNHLREYL